MRAKARVILFVLLIVCAVILTSYFDHSQITGKYAIGKSIEVDDRIDPTLNSYCIDGESHKADRCVDSRVLLEWYCHEGWCKETTVNCKDTNQYCMQGTCADDDAPLGADYKTYKN